MRKKRGWFITGTDTGIGKTTVTAGFLRAFGDRGYKTIGLKAVATGCKRIGDLYISDDAKILTAASTASVDESIVCPYAFEAPIAPHIAAKRVSTRINLDVIQTVFDAQMKKADIQFVEGAGGARVPLTDKGEIDMLSIAERLNLPVILVVGVRLGCINHALLTAEAIANEGLTLAGWVANRLSRDTEHDQEDMIMYLANAMPAPLIGNVPYSPEFVKWPDKEVAQSMSEVLDINLLLTEEDNIR